MRTKILFLSVLLALTSFNQAFAAYGDIDPGQCYPASAFLYRVVGKLNAHMYEIRGFNVPKKYAEALFETDYEIRGTGMIGGNIMISGTREVQLENGFTAKVFVFKDCKKE